MKSPLYLFAWFLKYTFFYFNDKYDLHIDIAANFSEFISEEELEEKKLILRDTPGPAGIKYAYFVGMKLFGYVGAICAISGVLLPIFIFTTIFFLINVYVKPVNTIGKWTIYILNGMAAATLGLIIAQMIKSVNHNKTNRRTILFIFPFAAFYVFVPESIHKSVLFNPIFFAILLVFSIIFAVSHIKIAKKMEERRNDPNYLADPYSKKAIRERDRKLREEAEEMKKEMQKQRERRYREEKEAKMKERNRKD